MVHGQPLRPRDARGERSQKTTGPSTIHVFPIIYRHLIFVHAPALNVQSPEPAQGDSRVWCHSSRQPSPHHENRRSDKTLNWKTPTQIGRVHATHPRGLSQRTHRSTHLGSPRPASLIAQEGLQSTHDATRPDGSTRSRSVGRAPVRFTPDGLRLSLDASFSCGLACPAPARPGRPACPVGMRAGRSRLAARTGEHANSAQCTAHAARRRSGTRETREVADPTGRDTRHRTREGRNPHA